MYGSSFRMETCRPRALRSRPMLAAVMPLPREEVTPPVTKTYFAMGRGPPGVFPMLPDGRWAVESLSVGSSPSDVGIAYRRRGRSVATLRARRRTRSVCDPGERDRPLPRDSARDQGTGGSVDHSG